MNLHAIRKNRNPAGGVFLLGFCLSFCGPTFLFVVKIGGIILLIYCSIAHFDAPGGPVSGRRAQFLEWDNRWSGGRIPDHPLDTHPTGPPTTQKGDGHTLPKHLSNHPKPNSARASPVPTGQPLNDNSSSCSLFLRFFYS